MECKDKTKKCCHLDMGRGTRFCNCGEEPQAEMCKGCFKLHTTDWLEDYPEVTECDIFEVRFKNTRRGYYKNVNNLTLKRGDIVAVEASPGHDIGIVSLTGDMVGRQMKRVGFTPLNGEFKKIYRKAKPYDIEKWQESIALEHETMIRSRQIAADMGLNMKIGDVEYQGDKIKAIFYYIADERVDFRELIKVFADKFRIRIEMKQIGARQEAGRIGGIGSCGRELCCASWIASFTSVTTNSARAQEISLNPQKLAGQCSKLKCCMIYEIDSYLDARKEFPRINGPLYTLDGEYFLVKSDILARTMSFSTSQNAMAGMIVLPISRVWEVLNLNKKGQKPESLAGEKTEKAKVADPGFVNMVGEESITRFDNVGSKNRRRPPRKKNAEGNQDARNENRPARENSGRSDQQVGRNRPAGDNSGRYDQQGGRNRPAGDNVGRNDQQGNRNRKPSGPKPDRNQPERKNPDQANSGERRNKRPARPPRGENKPKDRSE